MSAKNKIQGDKMSGELVYGGPLSERKNAYSAP